MATPRRWTRSDPLAALDRLREFVRHLRGTHGSSIPPPRLPVRLDLTVLELRMVMDGRPLPFPTIYAGSGDGLPGSVRAYDGETGALNFDRPAYDPAFTGGVRVAAADFTLDGFPDVLVGPGPGGGPNVRVLDGKTGDQIPGPLGSFWAYEPDFLGGVNVAAGDVNGDSVPDAVVAAGEGGGPRVRVFSGADGGELADFFAFGPEFRGGITVAAADLTGDGRAEVAVGAGPGGGPHVKVFDPLTGLAVGGPVGSFYAFDPAGRGGVNVGADALAGDVDADGVPDLAVGTGPGEAPGLRVFSGATGAVLWDLAPFAADATGGVRTALAYVDDDPYADVVAGTGPGPAATVRVFSGATGLQLPPPVGEYQPFGPGATGGVYVAASNDPPTATVTVFYDADGNGYWDAGEGTAAKVVVNLVGNGLDLSGLTNLSGSFTFGLDTGVDYVASVTPPSGYAAALPVEFTSPALPPFGDIPITLSLVPTGPPPPPAPVITAVGADTGDSATDRLTTDASPTVSGTAPAGAVVTVYDYWVPGAASPDPVALGTATANGSGLWTFTYGSDLPEGRHALSAAAGGSASAQYAYTIDATPPAVTLDFPAGTTDTVPTIWVTAAHPYGVSAATLTLDVDLNDDGDFVDAGEAGYAAAPLVTTGSPTRGVAAFGGFAPLPVGVDIGFRVGGAKGVSGVAYTPPSPPVVGQVLPSPTTWPAGTAVPATTSPGVLPDRSGFPGPSPPPTGVVGDATARAFTQPALLLAGSVSAAHPLDLDLSPAPARGAAPALAYTMPAAGVAPVVSAWVASNNAVGVPTQVVGTLTWDGKAAGGTTFPGNGLHPGAQWGFDFLAPANPATGPHTYTVDLFVDFPGTANDVTRSVTGRTFAVNRAGPFGAGWAFTDTDQLYDIAAWGPYPAGKLRAYGWGGWGFYALSGGKYVSPGGDGGELTAAGGGGYLYQSPDGRQWEFDGTGLQTRWVSADGRETVTYGYDATPRLVTVASPDTTLATFNYDGSGRVATVAAPGGRVTTLAYTGSDLTAVTDPAGGLHTFAYDAAHRPTGETWGSARTSYAYAATDLGVTATAGTETRTVRPVIGAALAAAVNEPRWATVTSGVAGDVVRTRMDDFWLPAEVRAADTGKWLTRRNANGFVDRETDPNNHQTNYTRDAAGYPTQVTYADGTSVTYAYQTAYHALTLAADEANRPTTYTYTGLGQLKTVAAPDSGVTTYTYQADGRLLTTTDPTSKVATEAYDSYRRWVGRLVGGATTGTVGYDAYGYANTWDDAYGARTTVVNDKVGRPVSVTTPDGATTTYTYDAAGRVLSRVGPSGATASVTYNLAGRPTVLTEALGAGALLERRTTTTYDGAGRAVTVVDPRGNTTGLGYDPVGRVNRVTDPLGYTVTLLYDLAGLLSLSLDPYGERTTYGYDARDRLTRVDRPLVGRMTYGYDLVGNVTLTVDPRGNTTTYSYDGRDRPTGVQDPAGKWATAAYDKAGRLVATVDQRLNTTTYDYDDRGRLWYTTDPLSKVTTFAYDAADRLVTVTDARGNVTTAVYDQPKARLLATVDGAGGRTTLTYDAAGRLSAVADPRANRTTFAYDVLDRVVGVQDAKSKWTTIEYDAQDRVTKVTNPRGYWVTAAYDEVGRLKGTTDQLQYRTTYAYGTVTHWTEVAAPPPNVSGYRPPVVTTYQYDPAGRLWTVKDTLGLVASFAYDPAGNVTAARDGSGVWTSYAYDKLNRVEAVVDALGKRATVAYDAAGNVSATVDQRLNTTTYDYDKLNRLVAVHNPKGEVSTIAYDAAGNVSGTADGRGYWVTYAYDKANRLESVLDPYLNRATVVYDLAGNVSATVDQRLNTTAYDYDELNRVKRVTDPLGKVTTVTYDDNGNVRTVTDPRAKTTTFEYDKADRLKTVIDAKGMYWRTRYDAAGNPAVTTAPAPPLDRTTATVRYDARSRPISVRNGLGELSSVAYDGAGRVSVAYDARGKRTTYAYDAVGRLQSVTDPLAKRVTYGYDDAGNVRTVDDQYNKRTTYGYDALNRVETVTDPLGKVSSVAYDGAGNVSAVVDQLGLRTTLAYDKLNRLQSVTDPLPATTTYDYDAAGNLWRVTGPEGGVTTYGFDALNRVSRVTDPLGNHTTLTYDWAGNLESVSDPRDATYITTFVYDARNQREAVVNPLLQRTTTVYDDAGRVSAVVDPQNVRTTFEYDYIDRVRKVTRQLTASTTGLTTIAYNLTQNTVARTDAAGTATTVYDDLGRP
ncbi:MAG: hypothetical protein K2X82_33065, partial [Gemmataceae bacterium]|nr:hypothetical protein [Gemmataceae bacterium]